ncbi:hypothetical protein [Serratia oryzae]|uniref:Uncharacterized protein n=1 Tax=Serratia oryzae TaxID=2034155 RepID=A0A1S8CLL9_9GAMM|nr:hypothetical protein [Serratia oryzae]OMQ24736.1 hypothetical protein BMI79_07910 [Serratia oryzae]
MGFFSKFGTVISDLVSAPIEALSDLIREPSKRWEHSREESSRKNSFEREKELRELEVDLKIKEKMGVSKSLFDLEELKKDNDFQRMIKTSEAIKQYLFELTKLNTDTIKAIGEMQLDLKNKAQELVYSKTIQYKELQDMAMEKAVNELIEIELKFKDNEVAKRILTSAVDAKLSNIINTANNFLIELNRDIVNLNNDISMLSRQGQIFIENHLNKIADRTGLQHDSYDKSAIIGEYKKLQ